MRRKVTNAVPETKTETETKIEIKTEANQKIDDKPLEQTDRKQKTKRLLRLLLLAIGIPCLLVGGGVLLHQGQYALVSLGVVLLALCAVFLSFERRAQGAPKLILIATMTALSVAGRLLFAPLPGFKPVTALVVLTAVYFGSEAGFLTGALAALLSNMYLGQGPWTPLQMFAWGSVGLLAGLLSGQLQKSRWLLIVYGAFAGVLYSLLMDVWTATWLDGSFHLSRYLTAVAVSLPFTVEYALSNVLFLLVLAYPLGRSMKRIKTKYGV